MPRLAFLILAGALLAPAASGVRAQEPAPEVGARPRNPTLGSPLLAVIRAYGKPSRVQSVSFVPLAGGKPTPAVVWIYERPNTATVEYTLGDDGKVVQICYRSKSLDPFRIEPAPPPPR